MQRFYLEYFKHNGKTYLIGGFRGNEGIVIKIYFDGQTLQEFEASASHEVLEEITRTITYVTVVDSLVEQARQYIRTNFNT